MGKILVTGGAGFLGSNLVNALECAGQSVVVLDDLSTGYRENLASANAELVVGSVEDAELVKSCAKECDAIFHLAALVSVPMSYQNPDKCRSVNVGGTINVLSAAEKMSVGKVIFISSASVYGAEPSLPQREDDEPNPKSPYAKSKLESELLCEQWAKKTGGSAISVRLFNGFGPRQRSDSQYGAVIPMFISAAMQNKPLQIHGSGEQTRDFIFIKDAVRALLMLLETDFSGVINVAGGREISIIKLAHIVKSLAGNNIPFEFCSRRAGDVERSCADISKLMELGFRTEYSLKRGIEITIEALKNGGQ